jgi:DNA-binding NtrC family response regulator
VLEDDPQINAAWAVLLDTWGVDARFATCASEAFEHLDSGFVPQAVLCDQRLRAGESGFEILQTLLQRCPQAYGVMVSGEYNSPELLRAEGDGYVVLRKPVDITVLHALLARWLAA